MQRLRSTQHGVQRLQGNTSNVIPRLLRRQRDTRGLRVEAHKPCAGILRAEALLHHLRPNLPGSAVFGDLLEKVIMGVEKEAEPRTEFIDLKPPAPGPLHIFHTVIQREGQFLQRGRSRLSYVISADRNRVEARRRLPTKLARVDQESHR